MFEYLDKLREKSDRTKKQVAFLIAFSFTGLIFVVWLSVIYPTWITDRQKIDKIAEISPSPTKTVTDTLSDAFRLMGDQIGQVKEAVSSLYTAPVYYAASSTEATSSDESLATSTASTTPELPN